MGYITYFVGEFKIEPTITLKDKNEFQDFINRRGKENINIVPPSYYHCPWEISKCGEYLEHDGGEKSYDYTKWLEYILLYFFKPKNYTLSGNVFWDGEETSDLGQLEVIDNILTIKKGRIIYE